jgi:2-polyprenyl-6-methoxyphenol hydroxylase-like FAD-dependent oxidoreductase
VLASDVLGISSTPRKALATKNRQDEDSAATESWTKVTTTDKALQAVKEWDPLVTEVTKATPVDQVSDWKLMWRDLQPQWTSKDGRVVQLGDAAILSYQRRSVVVWYHGNGRRIFSCRLSANCWNG